MDKHGLAITRNGPPPKVDDDTEFPTLAVGENKCVPPTEMSSVQRRLRPACILCTYLVSLIITFACSSIHSQVPNDLGRTL